MTTLASAPKPRPASERSSPAAAKYGVLAILVVLILFGWWRYDNFLSSYNVLTFLRYNSMFALIALGMTFVIITGESISRSGRSPRSGAWWRRWPRPTGSSRVFSPGSASVRSPGR